MFPKIDLFSLAALSIFILASAGVSTDVWELLGWFPAFPFVGASIKKRIFFFFYRKCWIKCTQKLIFIFVFTKIVHFKVVYNTWIPAIAILMLLILKKHIAFSQLDSFASAPLPLWHNHTAHHRLLLQASNIRQLLIPSSLISNVAALWSFTAPSGATRPAFHSLKALFRFSFF